MVLLENFKWVIGFAIVILSLWYTIRHFKIVRTISYIERFNTPTMIEIRAEVGKWAKLSDDEKLKSLEEVSGIYYKVNLIYNLITEIGISYSFGIINRKIACEIFDPLIPLCYDEIKPFIYYARSNGKQLGYYVEKVSNYIVEYRKKHPKSYKPIILNTDSSKKS